MGETGRTDRNSLNQESLKLVKKISDELLKDLDKDLKDRLDQMYAVIERKLVERSKET